jgi:putative ABC transport system substrate-binding protein
VVGYIATATGQTALDAPVYEGLRDEGYEEGRTVRVQLRSVEGHYERMPELARDFVAQRVAVIAAPNAQAALAAKAASQTIPIAFHTGVDPVALGLVKSLARPEGNASGVFSFTSGLVAKRVELVRDLVPRARSLAFLVNPAFVGSRFQVAELKQAVNALDFDLRVVEATSAAEIDKVFELLAAHRPDALMVAPDTLFTTERDRLVGHAARAAIPAVYDFPDYPAAGGLISYGPSLGSIQRLLGRYVGKMLKGVAPSNLPVQQSERFELVINMKTARALGLPIPNIVRQRADQVID